MTFNPPLPCFQLVTDPFFYMVAAPAVLLPLAPVGVWAGVYIARRINPALFYRLVYTGMFLTGCKLVWDGFKG